MRLGLAALVIALVVGDAAAAEPGYRDRKQAIERERRELAARPATRAEARAVLLSRADALMGEWFGTAWEFHGMSEEPRTGAIACGYFVSTILRDLGLRLPRIRLAQQASERIVTALVPAGRVRRFRDVDAAAVVESVRKQPDSLWIVGLDFHVGFLRVRAGTVTFCHSSYVEPAEVRCESPLTSPAFASRYRVVGELFDDALVDAWLAGRRVGAVR